MQSLDDILKEALTAANRLMELERYDPQDLPLGEVEGLLDGAITLAKNFKLLNTCMKEGVMPDKWV